MEKILPAGFPAGRRRALYYLSLFFVVFLFSMLLFMPGVSAQEGCECCDPGNIGGGSITICHVCDCPPGVTPGSTVESGTPIPVTPPPTATPLPPDVTDFCLSQGCAPDESRLFRVVWDFDYEYPLHIYPIGGCCENPCFCPDFGEPDQPVSTNGSSIAGLEEGACVTVHLPVWYAGRRPYPRALVTLGEGLWVSDAAGNPVTSLPVAEGWSSPVDPDDHDCDCRDDGSCDDDPPPEGTRCEFKLGLKAEPGSEPPTWGCEDDGGGPGYHVSCLWNHSSAGKDYLGKGLNCEDLPAFAVHASVPYWWSIGRQWEQWEQIGQDCECQSWAGWGAAECDLNDDGVKDADSKWVCDPIFDWKHHGPDWELLDLRDPPLSYPTPYMLDHQVQLAPSFACGPHPVGVLYVPCIEVQGVISNPKEP